MAQKLQMRGQHVNIATLNLTQDIQQEHTQVFNGSIGYEESESEYDEEQFANVDEDVINIRSKQKIKNINEKSGNGMPSNVLRSKKSTQGAFNNCSNNYKTSYAAFKSRTSENNSNFKLNGRRNVTMVGITLAITLQTL